MKISRLEGAALILTALFLAFTAGWMLRGSGDAPAIRVETQYTPSLSQRTASAPTPAPSAAPSPSAAPTAAPVPDKAAPGEQLNLNPATAEELQRLPGIGESRARAIVADREENGPFRIPEDLTRVAGIGEGILQGLLDYVTVE